jgi:tRNA nucleotidyltransferase/poly(A) polymerase
MSAASIPTLPRAPALPPAAAPAVRVARRLRNAGHEAYLVGGAVRDLLQGRAPGDFDVATSATPAEVIALFPRTEEVGIAFGVVLVIEDGTSVETATYRTDHDYRDGRRPAEVRFTRSLAADAARRDFTANALYLDPDRGAILDPCGGAADIRAGVLRAVGDPAARFAEDALRLLRLSRLAAQCGLAVEPATLAAARAAAPGLRRISAERVGKEMTRILTGPDPATALILMAETGVLELVLPEVAAMRGVPQPPEYHPEGDVWTHTLLALRAAPRRSLALGLAILLHDVGKPPTLAHADRIRFHGHAKLGAEMTQDIGRRLRLPAADVARAADLVAQHLRFLDVRRMRESTLRRFLRQPGFDEHLELHRVDCLASHGDLDHHRFCLKKLAELAEADLRPAPLLDGRDLLALGYEEGPAIGRLLRALETEQLEGRLATREEAEAWLAARHPLPRPPSAPSSQ